MCVLRSEVYLEHALEVVVGESYRCHGVHFKMVHPWFTSVKRQKKTLCSGLKEMLETGTSTLLYVM